MADEGSNKYDVGRGKPPTWTQFRKGQSGNPKGRPKKKVPTAPIESESRSDDILREILSREVTIRDAKGERKISSQEAVRQAQLKAALAGSPIAQRDVMREAQELELRDAVRAQQQLEEKRRDFERMLQWRETRKCIWAAAEREGAEPDDPWPHPDDIIVNETTQTYRIRGPLSETHLPRFEYFRAERDAAFMTHVIKLKTSAIGELGVAKIWAILWLSWDVILPLRWQNHKRHEELGFDCLCQPLRNLRKVETYLKAKAAELRPGANLPVNDKQVCREVNALMKPLLKPLGYSSLAQLEHAYENGLCE